MSRRVEDDRSHPFVIVYTAEFEALRAAFPQPRELPYALAVYIVLCELANEQHQDLDRVAARTTINLLCGRSGLGRSTALRYLDTLEEHNLIRGELTQLANGGNGPKLYHLLGRTPVPQRDKGGPATGPPTRTRGTQQEGMSGRATHNQTACAEGEQDPVAEEVARVREYRVDRKAITKTEAELLLGILHLFNERAGTTFTAHGRQNRARTCIVMRLREHHNLVATDHAEIIDRNFAAPWWDGTPSPQVIYGNATAFERARSAKRGRQVTSDRSEWTGAQRMQLTTDAAKLLAKLEEMAAEAALADNAQGQYEAKLLAHWTSIPLERVKDALRHLHEQGDVVYEVRHVNDAAGSRDVALFQLAPPTKETS